MLASGTAVQYETLTQAFRAVGSVTNITIDTLSLSNWAKARSKSFNELLPEEQQIGQDLYKSTMTLESQGEVPCLVIKSGCRGK